MDFFIQNCTFDKDAHAYFFSPNKTKMPYSVTQLIGFFDEFDSKKISLQIAKGLQSGKIKNDSDLLELKTKIDLKNPANKESAYQQGILELWQKAAADGTNVHEIAENYMKSNTIYEGTEYQKEFGFIKKLLKEQEDEGFMPVKELIEFRICDPEMDTIFHDDKKKGVGGSIDVIFHNRATNQYKIGDWKRTKPSKNPTQQIEHWMMQLGLYWKIITKYNKDFNVQEMVIFHVHPKGEGKKYSFKIKDCVELLDLKLFSPKEGTTSKRKRLDISYFDCKRQKT